MARPIRPYLEYQADRVEAVLNAHRAGGRITGGTVGPRLIRFYVQPDPHTRMAKVAGLADDLAVALRVPALSVDRDAHGIVLAFDNPSPRPVELLALLEQSRPIPPATALVGLSDAGQPLLVRLSSPEAAHCLVVGQAGAGKSALLRAMATSLVLDQDPNHCRLLCLAPHPETFRGLQDAPHLSRPVVSDPRELQESLDSAVRTMDLRARSGDRPSDGNGYVSRLSVPRLFVFADDLGDMMVTVDGDAVAGDMMVTADGDAITDAITRLVEGGHRVGVHLIAATAHPSAMMLNGVMRAGFPLRLVGRVDSPSDARIATGRASTEAHRLQGRGDFLAVGGGDPIRFQVADIAEGEITYEISRTVYA